MAGQIAATGISAIVNALAFSGSNFLFHMFESNKALAEAKRHNKALEDLTKARDAWSRNEIEKKDRIARLRQELSDANADINSTNKSLDDLKKVRTIVFQNRQFTRKPELRDFYQPSGDQKKYEMLLSGAAGIATSALVSWLI